MKISKSILLSVLSLFCSVMMHDITAQVTIVPLAGDQQANKHDGIYYALPKTMIKVDVWVDKVETIRGPYAEFAGRLLGLDNVPRTNSTAYHLAGATMSSYYEVDPDHYYFARIPEKNTNNLHFSLSPEGLLQSASWEEPSSQKKTSARDAGERKSLFGAEFMDIPVPGIIEKVDTFIRRISLDTTTFEEIFFRKTFIEKTTEQKAREAANFILKLEEHRFSLITGYQEVNYSAEVMQFMNQQLLDLQNEYLALFKGKKITTTSHYSFVYEPLPGNDKNPVTLFKFSANSGLIEKESPGGEPVRIHYSQAFNTQMLTAHQASREKGRKAPKGFYYRIPDNATFVLKLGTERVAEAQFPVSQLGMISFLPFEGIREVQFYPQSGSVKYFRLR